MNRIVMIGASGHGEVCAEIAELNGYGDILFLDDNNELTECGGHYVVGSVMDFKKYLNNYTSFFVSIGNAETRKRIQNDVEVAGGKMATLVHPNSVIGKKVDIGVGSAVMAGAIVNVGTEIGTGCILNTSSSVDHDCKIGNFCHVAVGAHVCGSVVLGEMVWVGAGATISNNVEICSGCIIGAGSVVVKNLEEQGTYMGVPARKSI